MTEQKTPADIAQTQAKQSRILAGMWFTIAGLDLIVATGYLFSGDYLGLMWVGIAALALLVGRGNLSNARISDETEMAYRLRALRDMRTRDGEAAQ